MNCNTFHTFEGPYNPCIRLLCKTSVIPLQFLLNIYTTPLYYLVSRFVRYFFFCFFLWQCIQRPISVHSHFYPKLHEFRWPESCWLFLRGRTGHFDWKRATCNLLTSRMRTSLCVCVDSRCHASLCCASRCFDWRCFGWRCFASRRAAILRAMRFALPRCLNSILFLSLQKKRITQKNCATHLLI